MQELHLDPVQQHRASAPVGAVTADVRPGQAERLAQVVHKELPGLHGVLADDPVDAELDVVSHGVPCPSSVGAAVASRIVVQTL